MKKHTSLLALVAVFALSTMALTGASTAQEDTKQKPTSAQDQPRVAPQEQNRATPSPANPGQHRGMTHDDSFDNATYKARSEMTRLWAEHEIFVRNYIVSASAGLPDATVMSNRLLENANEIGQALQPYYGTNASQKLTALMRDHVQLVAELVQAASGNVVGTTGTGTTGRAGTTTTGTGTVTGDNPTGTTTPGTASSDRTNTNGTTDRNMGGTTGSATTPPTTGTANSGVYGNTRNTTPDVNNRNIDRDRLSDVQRRLETNGKSIAAFLNSSNPNWKTADIEGMLQQHVDHLVAQVNARANGDWQGDLKAFDEALEHTFKFADTLSQGIERQFPDRFAQAKR